MYWQRHLRLLCCLPAVSLTSFHLMLRIVHHMLTSRSAQLNVRETVGFLQVNNHNKVDLSDLVQAE